MPAADAADGSPRRPLPLLSRPWFWLLVVAAGFSVPLVKSLRARLPPPLPGLERLAQDSAGRDDGGAERRLSELRGRIVVVTSLTLANATDRDAAFDALRRLRKRLRGLSTELGLFTLCSGGDAQALGALLDERVARRPAELYVLDPHRQEFRRLALAADSPSSSFLLLDRHGRIRGAYGSTPAELDRLVEQAGQLANWAAQDPALR